MMLSGRTTLTLLYMLYIAPSAFSQTSEDPSKNSIFDWFYAPEEVLEAEMQTDFETLAAQKMTNDELPGVVAFTNLAGETLSLPVVIRVRGRFRRRLCDFPPLKLDFDKSELKKNGLSNFDEYKLVTHCFDNENGDDLLLKEYLAYRLYQQMTEHSFRVQLFKIKYLDVEGKRRAVSYGIIIEDENELAGRLGCELIEGRYNVARDSLIHAEIHRHDLFQYMVCNTDWSLPMLRNMKLLWDGERQAYFVVPYDFDFSGLISAPYAVPNADIGQKNIRERRYMGIAGSVEELRETLAFFRSRRNALLGYVKAFKLLNYTDRRDMMEYLDTFYQSLEDGSFQAQVKGN